MRPSKIHPLRRPAVPSVSRRAALVGLATSLAGFGWLAAPQSRAQSRQGADAMDDIAMKQRMLTDLAAGGGLLVVAQWEAKQGEADKVADILRQFLPGAQGEAGVKLFLISRNRDNPDQFLFYELFADEAAFKAHQASDHFKTFIAGQALALLAKRERAQYALL
jgi:quinol monooxygenase YgiN